jgi:hypothetical protein
MLHSIAAARKVFCSASQQLQLKAAGLQLDSRKQLDCQLDVAIVTTAAESS